MMNDKTIFNIKQFIKLQVLCIKCGKQCLAARKVMNTKLQWMRENIFQKDIHKTLKIITKHIRWTQCTGKMFGLKIIPNGDVKMM